MIISEHQLVFLFLGFERSTQLWLTVPSQNLLGVTNFLRVPMVISTRPTDTGHSLPPSIDHTFCDTTDHVPNNPPEG